jgi:predicted DNA-binding protein (MmcQ/YjbR family)
MAFLGGSMSHCIALEQVARCALAAGSTECAIAPSWASRESEIMAVTRKGMTAAQLEALCGRWPGVTRDIKWGNDLVISVGGKMFVVTPADGSEGGRLSFKVEDDRFLELTDQPGIIAAPYMARARWISVTEPQRFPAAELEALIRTAYALVRAKLTKKLQAELGPWLTEQSK